MCLKLSVALIVIFLLPNGLMAGGSEHGIRVAYFSQDPPSIEPLSPSFDPDSYSVITQIFDSLIHFDLDGNIKPGLAVSWKMLSDTTWHFKLREGVRFHNGEIFDAEAVRFTFDYILNKSNSAGNHWVFNSIKSVNRVPGKPYEVIFETYFPDGMFLNRLNMFGSICPPKYFKEVGLQKFSEFPVGTGPYRFDQWKKKHAITLVKNPHYWQTDKPYLQSLEFKIIPEPKWADAILNNEVDFIPNLSGKQTSYLMKRSKGNIRIVKRLVLSGYWVMLKNTGVLSDLKVRQALNHAVNKKDLVRFADFGNAKPLASLGKEGEFGQHPNLNIYPYDPGKAKELLLASVGNKKIVLKILAADVAESVAHIIERNLSDIGISVEMNVVSRAEWAQKVIGYKLKQGTPPDYDITINLVDNPVYNLAFHAGLFLHSPSPWSLLKSDEFDQLFEQSLRTNDKEEHNRRLQRLDKYIHDNALMLFTTQRIITAAVQETYDIQKFGINGHLDYEILTNAKRK